MEFEEERSKKFSTVEALITKNIKAMHFTKNIT